MQKDDILWNFSAQKRGRPEEFDGDETNGFPLGTKVARTRSIERVSSQKSIMDMLEFGEHRHMLHVRSFGSLTNFDDLLSADFQDVLDGLDGLDSESVSAVSFEGESDTSMRDVVRDGRGECEECGTGEAVDQGRFKLVSLLGYKKSMVMAREASRHVASGVPFMMPDNIQECLVPRPDVAQELLRCF